MPDKSDNDSVIRCVSSSPTMMHSKWNKRNIEIDFERREMVLYANEELMKQVFINLLDNAVNFSPDDSSITVMIQKKAHSLVFLSVTKEKVSIKKLYPTSLRSSIKETPPIPLVEMVWE